MKKILTLCVLLTVTVCCALPVGALTENEYDSLCRQQFADVGADGLSALTDDDTRILLEQLGLDGPDPQSLLNGAAPENFLNLLSSLTRRALPAPLTAFLSLGAVLIVCHLLTAFNSRPDAAFGTAYEWFSAVSGAVVLLTPLIPMLTELSERIRSAAGFMTGFVPVFCAAVSGSGQPATAVLSGAALLTVSELSVQIAAVLLIPMSGVFAALGLVGGAAGQPELNRLSDSLKKAVLWGLGTVTALYVGFLSLKSTVAAAGDSMALRAAKLFVSGGIPVVGSGLSEAMGAVFSGMKLVKSAVGVYGIAAVVLCVLPSVIRLLLWKLAVSVGGSLAESGGNATLARLCRTVGDLLSVLLAVSALVGLGFLLCVVSVLRTVA